MPKKVRVNKPTFYLELFSSHTYQKTLATEKGLGVQNAAHKVEHSIIRLVDNLWLEGVIEENGMIVSELEEYNEKNEEKIAKCPHRVGTKKAFFLKSHVVFKRLIHISVATIL